jgi:endonuclease/exonuclease/phosphatase family metal-dependent hydrolase
MWAKILLGALLIAMISAAIHFEPSRQRSLLGTRSSDGPRLRLMTWNIGYAGVETDSRARTEDMKFVAETILKHDPDAVALQELSGDEQFQVLLEHLQRRYIGAVGKLGRTDRVEAVLIKTRENNSEPRFEDIPSGDRYALGASFHFRNELPEIVLVSAHADAYSSERRRAFTGDVVDWARTRTDNSITFIAGDFNFEINSKGNSNLFTDNLKHDSEAYSYVLKFFRDLGRDAGKTAINERRIDYIFGLPEVALLRRAEVLKDSAVGQMDHWPLLIEVAL